MVTAPPLVLPCPRCSAPIGTLAACPTCSLRLVGPEAVQLRAIDVELAGWPHRRALLVARRTDLISAMGNPTPALTPPAQAFHPAAPVPPVAPREANPQQAQNILLGLGASVLALAGLLFVVYASVAFGPLGQVATLLALACGTGAAAVLAQHRALVATADAFGSVTLAVVELALLAGRPGLALGAAATGLVAVVGAAAGIRGRLRAVVGTAAVLDLGACAAGAYDLRTLVAASGLLTALAVGHLALTQLGPVQVRAQLRGPAAAVAVGTAAAAGVLGTAAAGLQVPGASGALLAVGCVPGLAAALTVRMRTWMLGLVALVGQSAILVAAFPSAGPDRPLEAVGVAAVVALSCLVIPTGLRGGPVVAAAVVGLPAVLGELPVVVRAVQLPLGAVPRAWSGPATVPPLTSSVAPAVLLVGALLVFALLRAQRLPHPEVPGAATVLLAALTFPLDLTSSLAGALVATLVTVAAATRRPVFWALALVPLLRVVGLAATTPGLSVAAVVVLLVAVVGLRLVTGEASPRLVLSVASGVLLPGAAVVVGLAECVHGGPLGIGLAALVLAGVAGASLAPLAQDELLGLYPVAVLTAVGAVAFAAPDPAASTATAGLLFTAALLSLRRGRVEVARVLAAVPAVVLLALTASSAARAAGAPAVGQAVAAAVALVLVPAAVLVRPPFPHGGSPAAETGGTSAALLTALTLDGCALAVAHPDAGAVVAVLLAAAVQSVLVAARFRQSFFGYAGVGLVVVASWVTLGHAGVMTPEAYTGPAALLLLAAGAAARYRTSTGGRTALGSWPAFGPGLVALALPTLLVVLATGGLGRTTVLGVGAAVMVLVGARERLRAPLVVGSAALLADGFRQLAPLASELPRWTVLAAIGAVLLASGATYEARRRDLARIRVSYGSLS